MTDALPMLYLARHGETAWSLSGRHTGLTDVPLTERGERNAHGLGEQPQPLYSVRFDAVELWGESAEPNQRVHLDLWESYLAPAVAAGGARSLA